MANVTNISVLDSTASTATVSTLDAFRSNIGTSSLSVSNATASLLNATVVGTAVLAAGAAQIGSVTAALTGAIPAGTNAIGSATIIGSLPAGAALLGTVTANLSPTASIFVANATASLLNATVIGTATISGSVTVTGTVTGTSVLAAGASQVGSVTAILSPPTAGGLLKSSTVATASNNLTVVKASAGQVYTIVATNNTATIAYLKLYDNTTVSAGTGTPVWRVMIPGSGSGGAGIVEDHPLGLAFTTGICFATTGGIADTDTSVVTVNTLLINIGYK